MTRHRLLRGVFALAAIVVLSAPAMAHKLAEKGKTVTVAASILSVTPSRDWNRLSTRAGKHVECWTLDGEQLDEVRFYAAIEPGEPLMHERYKRKDPLPKFRKETLPAELPELLERTYRSARDARDFQLQGARPAKFLGRDGIAFTYMATDADGLIRKGEARAAIVEGRLYMITFDAPRLHYFDLLADDARALMASATL
ncbi:hypothetical protein [Sphingomonas sp. TDK1]|uniref:hypothetical protein n=1 Tax=Sphingomonas sp. TDK1 TaxID=453247 RepID=UPI0007DA05F5|nr:hypothetical protein [Sphingomonas sp. TDK1]OAN57211.1 hypothetical protein A7X12_08300 [Sphingomonas sp. TDK1]